jgi:glutamine synthetase
MAAAERAGFVARHGLWSERQYADEEQMRRVIDELGVELVRVAFSDQCGVLRGKTVTRAALPGVLRSGITVPSSLLLKDMSGQSTFPVFEALELDGYRGFSGAGDIVLVPDPSTFRVLPWSRRTAIVLSDLHYPDGRAVPYCTRGALRRALSGLAERGLGLTIGPELEFHVFAAEEGAGLRPERVGRPGLPGEAPRGQPLSPGSQLLHLDALDRVDDLVAAIHEGLTMLDLPLRTLELEFGASQFEVTLDAGDAADVADDVVLCRMAIKQVCRRIGLHATFMARPRGSESASTGWHLHQSLRDLHSGAAVFASDDPDQVLSRSGLTYLGGLLEHAAAATAFTTPTVNGYKRYQPQSLAPDRVGWGLDNKGAMVRVVGGPGDPNAHLENRSGEPGANPYLYILSQLVSGLDGMDRLLDPGIPTDSPYLDDVERLPRTLAEAVNALDASAVFRAALGDDVVDWYVHLKRAEFGRYLAEVSEWEQREYFDLL